MLRLISFASLCAMMISCSSGTDNKERIVANLDDFTTPEIKIERVIQLETRNDALIGEHFRIKTTKEHVIIGDDDKIMVFNRDGSVKSVFSPRGRGPREATHISSYITDDNGHIIIIDTELCRLLEFDADGKFISSKNVPARSSSVMLFNDRIFTEDQYGSNETGKVLKILSNSGELLKNEIDLISPENNYGSNKFQKFDDYVLYLPSHHNQIYKIDKRDSISVAYSFDFGRRWPSQNIFEKYANSYDNFFALWKYISENSLIGFLYFMDSEKWLVLNYTQKEGKNNWFYNKKNGTQHLVKFDPNGSLAGYPIMCVDDNKFISMVSPGDIPTELKDMNLKTSENDNPAVVIWSVK